MGETPRADDAITAAATAGAVAGPTLAELRAANERLRVDDAERPRYIQTVWGIDYRFLRPE